MSQSGARKCQRRSNLIGSQTVHLNHPGQQTASTLVAPKEKKWRREEKGVKADYCLELLLKNRKCNNSESECLHGCVGMLLLGRRLCLQDDGRLVKRASLRGSPGLPREAALPD